jgi:hypothetical protein
MQESLLTIVDSILLGKESIDRIRQFGLEQDKESRWLGFIESQRAQELNRALAEEMSRIGFNGDILKERDHLIQSLSELRRHHKADLADHDKNLHYILVKVEQENKSIQWLEVQAKGEGETSQSVAAKKIEKHREEIEFLEKKIQKTMEMTRVKHPEIDRLEQALKKLLESEASIVSFALEKAKCLGLSNAKVLEVSSPKLNGGLYRSLCLSTWKNLLDGASEDQRPKLHKYFDVCEDRDLAVLKDEVFYRSVFSGDVLVGKESASSGISYLDDGVVAMLKSLLAKIKPSLEEEEREFYDWICRESLADGVLSVDEIQRLMIMGHRLSLSQEELTQRLNDLARDIKRSFVQKNLKFLMNLAMSDGEVHASERDHVMAVKHELEKGLNEMVFLPTDGQKLISPMDLGLDEEKFFITLCQLAMGDGMLALEERVILNDFAKSKGWTSDKISELVKKAKG